MSDSIQIVFDGPPGPTAGRFVEVEDAGGKSSRIGEWHERSDGYWALIIPGLGAVRDLVSALEDRMEDGGYDPDSAVQQRCEQLIALYGNRPDNPNGKESK